LLFRRGATLIHHDHRVEFPPAIANIPGVFIYAVAWVRRDPGEIAVPTRAKKALEPWEAALVKAMLAQRRRIKTSFVILLGPRDLLIIAASVKSATRKSTLMSSRRPKRPLKLSSPRGPQSIRRLVCICVETNW
jgi:hypothetical protein